MKPLEYNSGLSLEESNKRYQEVETEFKNVKKKYGFLKRIFYPIISPEDQKRLGECTGVLLPLSLEKAVQEEAFNSTEFDIPIIDRIAILQSDIGEYLSRFKNTGVKTIRLRNRFIE